jgi:glutaredoxin-related protein
VSFSVCNHANYTVADDGLVFFIPQGLKRLKDWPTFPQLIVKGEFVGGLDIAKEAVKNSAFGMDRRVDFIYWLHIGGRRNL